LSFFHL